MKHTGEDTPILPGLPPVSVRQPVSMPPKDVEDEGDDALNWLRFLVQASRDEAQLSEGDCQAILSQEMRLRAYLSGLRAR